MNATATPTRKHTAKAITAPLTIRPFTVSEERIEITVSIPATTAAFLSSQSDYIRSKYGDNVASFALSPAIIIRAGQRGEYSAAQVSANLWNKIGNPALAHGRLQGRKTAEIKIAMKPHQWESVETVAAFYKCSEAAIVRAALEQRRRGLIEFDRKEAQAKLIEESTSVDPLPQTAPEQLTHGLNIPVTDDEFDAWLTCVKYSELHTASQWGRRALLAAARLPVSKKAKEKPIIPQNENQLTLRFTLAEHLEFSKKAEQHGLSLLEWACLSLRSAWSKKAA